ncbi:MAG TPA: hypothetical protein VMV92_43500 [Streptosporangiaceae bacterium]|nr:hypothetical protein [Streptosporangiaceae bacterium]
MTTVTPQLARTDVANRARDFLAATVDLDPGTPHAELVRLLGQYRAHLAAMVARPGDGLQAASRAPGR